MKADKCKGKGDKILKRRIRNKKIPGFACLTWETTLTAVLPK